MRKGEIACYKHILLFSQRFIQLYILSASKCGIVWKWVRGSRDAKYEVIMYMSPALEGLFFLGRGEENCFLTVHQTKPNINNLKIKSKTYLETNSLRKGENACN